MLTCANKCAETATPREAIWRRHELEIIVSIVYLVLLFVLIGRTDPGRAAPRFKPDTRSVADGRDGMVAREGLPERQRAA